MTWFNVLVALLTRRKAWWIVWNHYKHIGNYTVGEIAIYLFCCFLYLTAHYIGYIRPDIASRQETPKQSATFMRSDSTWTVSSGSSAGPNEAGVTLLPVPSLVGQHVCVKDISGHAGTAIFLSAASRGTAAITFLTQNQETACFVSDGTNYYRE